MPVQRQRSTKHRRDVKRKRLKIKTVKTIICPKCGKRMLSHRACPGCGYYRGKEIVNTLKKVAKKKKK
ncbi:MAG TPA: 50S ribosomal protein L32 [Candidatus Moranbacteria bacterium]|nr:50S ribosomal protein L32 [Candidatus Moranbacteria bacterium]